MIFTDASICIKQLLAITNGSLFNVETTSHIYTSANRKTKSL